jgi:hypothetical protein
MTEGKMSTANPSTKGSEQRIKINWLGIGNMPPYSRSDIPGGSKTGDTPADSDQPAAQRHHIIIKLLKDFLKAANSSCKACLRKTKMGEQ